MKILVTGASGMLGQRVVPALLAEGFEVRCFVRPQSVGKLRFDFMTELCLDRVDNSLEKSLSGCRAVVNLVGIIRESFPTTFRKVHVEYVQRLLKAARKQGVKRIIQVSAVGASAHSIHPYLRTKYEGERLLRESGLDYTVFRPTFMYDRGGLAIETFIRQVRRLPVVPVIGDGSYRQQPLFAGDLAAGIARSLAGKSFIKKTYQAGGPEQLTYNQLLDRIGSVFSKKVRKLKVPVRWARKASALLGQFRFYPLDPDQLELLLMDDICDEKPFYRDFGIIPTLFINGLSKVISHV
ncbi:MAG: complex I NDUFA9 subunit family protein [bacterium]